MMRSILRVSRLSTQIRQKSSFTSYNPFKRYLPSHLAQLSRFNSFPATEIPVHDRNRIVTKLFESFCSPDGTMEPQHLNTMLNSMGIYISAEKLCSLVNRADVNGDGVISEEEFLQAYSWLLDQEQTDEDYRAIFNVLDSDKNGTIELEELIGIMSSTKKRLTKDEAESIMEMADKDKDGVLGWEDFRSFMHEDKARGWKLLTTFRVIFVTGGPASGKGTLSALLVERMKGRVVHVSSGDLLRDEVESGSKLGQEISSIMKRGELVSAEIVIALLEKFIYRHPGKLLLLDGFPRSIENAKDFYRMFGPGEGILCFDCPDEVMISRILERGKLSGRSDDNLNTAKQRIKTFHEQSKGPLKYLKGQKCPLYQIDATKSIEENLDKLLHLPMFTESRLL